MKNEFQANEATIMNESHALMSAARCLGCHDAPCMHACPAGVDVPGFIRRFLDGNLQGAGALVYERCPLGATCGMACPTGRLCEGACVLHQAGQPPVPIGALQAFVCMQYGQVESPGRINKPARMAVIGAGPAGLGCAVVLRRHGHEVDLYDRRDRMAGLVDQVIPSYRLPAAVVARDLNYINSLNLNFLSNRNIDSSEFNRIRSGYDAVFLGTGMGALQKADFPGKSAEGVVDALDFLQRARAGKMVIDSQQTVVVIGGGNVALDAAVVAKRSGAGEVIVLYRRSRDEMPGWESEYLEATRLGVEFRWLSTLAVIEQTDGKVKSVQVQKMHFTNEMRSGRRWVEAAPEQSLSRVLSQMVILALGQEVERDWLEGLGLLLTPDGFPLVNVGTGQTNLPMVFAGGELVSGGATIVDSLHQGMLAGERIQVLLSGEGG